MPEEYVVNFVEEHRSFFEPLHPSFFELTTAMAFRYFADQKVDVAVIEVGMGGRLDCTNIISPLMRMRSRKSTKRGEVNKPTRYPADCNTAAIVCEQEPFPLVLAICIVLNC